MEVMFILAFWGLAFWICWLWFLRDFVMRLSVTKVVKSKFMASQIPEEAYYEQAAHEISQDRIRPGLWAKAWSQSGGDNIKAQALYIKLRVSAMRDETAAKIHGFSAKESSSFGTSPADDPIEKTVVSCPKCSQNLRVAAGKYVEIKCPKCNTIFNMQT